MSLDGPTTPALFATKAEVAARQARRAAGVPLGQPVALADRIANLVRQPAEANAASRNAWEFSRRHGLLPEFKHWMGHLAQIAGVKLPDVAA
jgi:hypothetical protein